METYGSKGETGKRDVRVMVVDDDPVVLNLLSCGLTSAGYLVDTCAEAGCALERYRSCTPDIAVLDVGLPDMSGTELARELLRAEYRPLLILSNHNDQEIVRQAITSGVVGYLVKPLSVEQLIPSLETSLSRHDRRGEHVASHLGCEDVTREHLAAVMDGFPFALLIIDEHRHPIYRNAAARRLLDEGILDIDPAGRLRSRGSAREFASVLDGALGRSAAPRSGAVVLDERPTRRLHAWGSSLGSGTGGGEETLAAVAVFNTQSGNTYAWEALNALYGLTRKETAVVNGLLQGLSPEEYCSANFVTANTVRTHLKSIYRKTGTNRQSEVVRLFASMFAPR